MLPDTSQIFASPDYHCLGFGNDRAKFVLMDREHYQRSVFLDRRLSAKSQTIVELPLQPLIEEGAGRHEMHGASWIFHVAHCGSTLLANLLDQPGRSLLLREPPALRQVGVERGEGASDSVLAPRMMLAQRLSARRYSIDECPVIKANVPVNFILDLVDQTQWRAPAVMLHLGWRSYLLAILRTDNHRAWLQRISGIFRRQIEETTAMPLSDRSPERAAALWLAQMRTFAAYIERNPNAAALDAQHLFDQPILTAEAVASHLRLIGVEPNGNSALLTSYSKDPSRPFDSHDRRARALADEQRLAAELSDAEAWLGRAAAAGAEFSGFKRSIEP